MNKSGQQAMEYLITHGWMIMVSVMVAGALVYVGVFDTDRYIPQQCSLTFDFGCEQYVVKETGEVRVMVSNQMGEPLKVSSFNCTYEDGSFSLDTTSGLPISNWFPGNTQEFVCDAPAVSPIDPSKKAQVKVSMIVRKETGGFSKRVSGQIIANPS